MSSDAYRRIAEIGRCQLVFGVPLDLPDFRADLESPDRDFVRSCCAEWPRYRGEIIEPAAKVIADARRYGANVVVKATLDHFANLFRRPVDLVILITHWRDDTIELRDGMHGVRSVVERVPPDFDGAFDLCVCHPELLALAFRDLRPDTVTRYPQQPANPRIFFPYIRALLWRLSFGNCSYLDAAAEVTGAFLEPSKGAKPHEASRRNPAGSWDRVG